MIESNEPSAVMAVKSSTLLLLVMAITACGVIFLQRYKSLTWSPTLDTRPRPESEMHVVPETADGSLLSEGLLHSSTTHRGTADRTGEP